jgi:hypothetical protein
VAAAAHAAARWLPRGSDERDVHRGHKPAAGSGAAARRLGRPVHAPRQWDRSVLLPSGTRITSRCLGNDECGSAGLCRLAAVALAAMGSLQEALALCLA